MTSGNPLLYTATGEPFVPVRLYWTVKSKPAVTEVLGGLRCIEQDRKAKCWVWLYDDEATSLLFGIPRERLSPAVHPIVIGRFRFPDAKQLVLEVRSVERAIAAAKFFAPRFGPTVVLSRLRIINRLFERNEAALGLDRLDRLLDTDVTRIDPAAAAERADVPLVEDFPLAPEEETPEFRDLTMTLHLRALRAREHWKGNTAVTLVDVIKGLVG